MASDRLCLKPRCTAIKRGECTPYTNHLKHGGCLLAGAPAGGAGQRPERPVLDLKSLDPSLLLCRSFRLAPLVSPGCGMRQDRPALCRDAVQAGSSWGGCRQPCCSPPQGLCAWVLPRCGRGSAGPLPVGSSPITIQPPNPTHSLPIKVFVTSHNASCQRPLALALCRALSRS